LVQITSDIELSGAGCTTAITPNQLVQSSSENDIKLARLFWAMQRGRVDLVVDLAGGDLAVDLRPGAQAKKNRPGVRGGEVGRSCCYPILAARLGRCSCFCSRFCSWSILCAFSCWPTVG